MWCASMAPHFWPAMGRPCRVSSTGPCGPSPCVAPLPWAAISRSVTTVGTRSRRTTRAGHRSCPTCHGAAQAAWRAAREREVLETPYVHVIFTLPHDLSALALQNPRHLYGLLFRTVAQTLQDIAGDPKHLGAEIGGFAVLHTW